MRRTMSPPFFIEHGISLSVLAVVMAYSLAQFFHPYLGFNIAQGRISQVFVSGGVQEGDRLVSVAGMSYQEFNADLRRPFLAAFTQDKVVPITVQRDSQTLTIEWNAPQFTEAEFFNRLANQWIVAFLFWCAGEFILLSLRPRNLAWRLLVAFSFLTAIWLAASVVSRWHLLESAIVLRVAIWLSVPVYLHLHWAIPKPLFRVPRSTWPVLYVVAGLLAGGEWFQLLPINLYGPGLLVAVGGSALLLLARYLFRPEQRRDAALLIQSGLVGLAPVVALLIAVSALGLVIPATLLLLLGLPFLIMAYIYTAYRHQLGEQELRANRILAGYSFLILLTTLNILLFSVVSLFALPPFLAGLLSSLVALAALASYPAFQRWFNRQILGIRLPPDEILDHYMASIIASLDLPTLVRAFEKDILPNLLVYQSALITFNGHTVSEIHARGLHPGELPSSVDQISALLAETGKMRSAFRDPCQWASIALPLSINNKPFGLWLLGRHDPDDFFNQQEIVLFQSLANQTAIALAHIVQADRLRALYRENVTQRDAERAKLSRELHDSILPELNYLKEAVPADHQTAEFLELYSMASDELRRIVTDLRPTMVDYGLHSALTHLIDDLTTRTRGDPEITLAVSTLGTPLSHANVVVENIYRIVQQACENAIRHARAASIRICGDMSQDSIDLTVIDDGLGFDVSDPFELDRLDAREHFGLMMMRERADSINAVFEIHSARETGTNLHIRWRAAGVERPE